MAINKTTLRKYLNATIGMNPVDIIYSGKTFVGLKSIRSDSVEMKVAGLLPSYKFSLYLNEVELVGFSTNPTLSEDSSNVTGLEDMSTGSTYSGTTGTAANPSKYTLTMEAVESGDITGFATANSGTRTEVVTSLPHGLSTSDEVTIVSNDNIYDGVYTIEVVSATEFEIAFAFNTNDQPGTWEKTNTFQWRKGSGVVTAGVDITGSAQTVAEDIRIKFASRAGHTEGDYWVISVYPEIPVTGPNIGETVIISGATYRVLEISNDPADAYIRLDLGGQYE